MVVENRGGTRAGQALDELLEKAEIQLVPVTSKHASAARRAWRRFGKSNYHAALNFGESFAYALAEADRRTAAFQGVRTSPVPTSRQHE